MPSYAKGLEYPPPPQQNHLERGGTEEKGRIKITTIERIINFLHGTYILLES
jgi:hypothetical protein